MNRDSYEKKFNRDPDMLMEMLELRKDGWSLTALGQKYGVDHTSVLYQCRKFNVAKSATQQINITQVREMLGVGRLTIDRRLANGFGETYNKWYVMPDGERINRGKTYAQYMQEARKLAEAKRKSPLFILLQQRTFEK